MNKIIFCIILVLLSNLNELSAQCNDLAFQSTESIGNQAYTGQLGNFFTTSKPIIISELGVFDSNLDGIQSAGITVGIIDINTNNTVVGPITITGTQGSLTGNFRMVGITEVTLPVGDYALVAVGYNASEQNGNGGINPTHTAVVTGYNVISFTGNKYSNTTTFGLPTIIDGAPLGQRYLAGTFKFHTPVRIGSVCYESISSATNASSPGQTISLIKGTFDEAFTLPIGVTLDLSNQSNINNSNNVVINGVVNLNGSTLDNTGNIKGNGSINGSVNNTGIIAPGL